MRYVHVDDIFEISDPIGRFDFVQAVDNDNDVLMLAAGTGITPMINLIEVRHQRQR